MALSQPRGFLPRQILSIGAPLITALLLGACAGSPTATTPAARSQAAGSAPTATTAASTTGRPTVPPATITAAATASPAAAGAASAQSSQIDPCTLASAAEIQSALGTGVAGSGTSANGGCEWKLANGSRLHVQDYGVAAEESYQMMLRASCGTNIHCEPIAGLGKQATYREWADGKVILERSVLVRLPDDIVEITQSKSDNGPPASKDALLGLARIVAGHRS